MLQVCSVIHFPHIIAYSFLKFVSGIPAYRGTSQNEGLHSHLNSFFAPLDQVSPELMEAVTIPYVALFNCDYKDTRIITPSQFRMMKEDGQISVANLQYPTIWMSTDNSSFGDEDWKLTYASTYLTLRPQVTDICKRITCNLLDAHNIASYVSLTFH